MNLLNSIERTNLRPPHMTTREDLGGTDLRKGVLGRRPETSPVCRGPGAHR